MRGEKVKIENHSYLLNFILFGWIIWNVLNAFLLISGVNFRVLNLHVFYVVASFIRTTSYIKCISRTLCDDCDFQVNNFCYVRPLWLLDPSAQNPRQATDHRFYHPHNIGWGVHINQLHITYRKTHSQTHTCKYSSCVLDSMLPACRPNSAQVARITYKDWAGPV
jgi:hypothetical protein